MNKITDVDAYIESFPPETQAMMKKVRNTIKSAATDAEEVISYQMPGYKYKGMLVWFAAYKNHIGFYPGAGGIAAFKSKLSMYKGAKGSVQFPLDKPIPYELITEIVKFRVAENEMKFNAKRKAEKAKTGVYFNK